MTKRARFISIIGVIGVIGAAAGIAQFLATTNQGPSVKTAAMVSPSDLKMNPARPANTASMQTVDGTLEISAVAVDGVKYTPTNLPIDIAFTNNADQPVRILDEFRDPRTKKVFFSVVLRDANGSPLFTEGGGKVDLSGTPLTYIELKKGEKATVRIDLTEYVPASRSLSAGVYSLTVIYRNQYGENCFKGRLDSNDMNLALSDN